MSQFCASVSPVRDGVKESDLWGTFLSTMNWVSELSVVITGSAGDLWDCVLCTLSHREVKL